VSAREALALGLANRLSPTTALEEAIKLAELLVQHPQTCMRNDLQAVYAAEDAATLEDALAVEFGFGLKTVNSGEFVKPSEAFLNRSDTRKAKL
jgi:enoyl-CoA hydratase